MKQNFYMIPNNKHFNEKNLCFDQPKLNFGKILINAVKPIVMPKTGEATQQLTDYFVF